MPRPDLSTWWVRIYIHLTLFAAYFNETEEILKSVTDTSHFASNSHNRFVRMLIHYHHLRRFTISKRRVRQSQPRKRLQIWSLHNRLPFGYQGKNPRDTFVEIQLCQVSKQQYFSMTLIPHSTTYFSSINEIYRNALHPTTMYSYQEIPKTIVVCRFEPSGWIICCDCRQKDTK